MAKVSNITALVLAGGAATRMGRDKSEIELSGKTLLERTVERALEVFDKIIISGRDKHARLGHQVVRDSTLGQGPLIGIREGLLAAETEHVFALPCDSPFVPAAFLRGMAALAEGNDVAAPRAGQFYEPLHAVYGKGCLPAMERMIESGERQIVRLYPRVRVLEVPPSEYLRWDPEGMAFFNINTPEDLEAARRIIEDSAPGRTG